MIRKNKPAPGGHREAGSDHYSRPKFGRPTEVARRVDDLFGGKPDKPARGSADALDLDLGTLLAAFHAAGKQTTQLAVYPDQYTRLQGAGLIRDGKYMGIPIVVVRRGTHLVVNKRGAI